MSEQTDNSMPTVLYNGLLMQQSGDGVLCCEDDAAIIDWLSQFQYPREFLRQDSVNTVVFLRDGKLDLVIAHNFMLEGDKGLTVCVWLDFVGQQIDLRYLGRPFDEAHEAQYKDIWQNIAKQIRHIGQHTFIPSIAFKLHDGQVYKPHFAYL